MNQYEVDFSGVNQYVVRVAGEKDPRNLEDLEELVWSPSTSHLSDRAIDQFMVIARYSHASLGDNAVNKTRVVVCLVDSRPVSLPCAYWAIKRETGHVFLVVQMAQAASYVPESLVGPNRLVQLAKLSVC